MIAQSMQELVDQIKEAEDGGRKEISLEDQLGEVEATAKTVQSSSHNTNTRT